MRTLLMLLCCAALAPAFAENVTFRFVPQDGLTYVETTSTTQINSSTIAGKQSGTEVAKQRITIHKTATGYTVELRPLSLVIMQDGKQKLALKEADLVSDRKTYVANANGQLVKMLGLDAAIARYKKSLPPEAVKKFDANRYQQALFEKNKAEWSNKIGRYLGKTVAIGDVWRHDEPMPSPGGKPIAMHSTMKFIGRVQVNGKSCIHTVETKQPDKAALMAAMNSDLKTATGGKGTPAKVTSLTYLTTIERTFDPAVLLSFSEKASVTHNMTMQVPGKGTVTTTSEKHVVKTVEFGR